MIKRLFRGAVLLLALCFLFGSMAPSGFAASWDVEIDHDCSLKISSGSPEQNEDLALANIVYDLYLIADAIDDPIMYGYGYDLHTPYASLTITDTMQDEDWTLLAQKAAQLALAQDTPALTAAPVDRTLSRLDDGSKLGCGLYLILARGADLTDYVLDEETAPGVHEIKTIGRSPEYEYRFAPQLISLPGRDPGVTGTGTPGTWYYDLHIELKPEREVRLGSIEIIKTLLSYRASESASFVFSVDAVRENQLVFSDVVALGFDDAGSSRVRIDNLPAGSEVTVREIYSGACYAPDSSDVASKIVVADSVEPLSFVNDYDEEAKGGHGIVNNFRYSATGDWIWTQGTDSAAISQGGNP